MTALVNVLCSSGLPHGRHTIAGGGRCDGFGRCESWSPPSPLRGRRRCDQLAGHDGPHSVSEGSSWSDPHDVPVAEVAAEPGLPAGQEIRARAVDAAARLWAGKVHTPSYLTDKVLDTAQRLATFIATGEGEVSDAAAQD